MLSFTATWILSNVSVQIEPCHKKIISFRRDEYKLRLCPPETAPSPVGFKVHARQSGTAPTATESRVTKMLLCPVIFTLAILLLLNLPSFLSYFSSLFTSFLLRYSCSFGSNVRLPWLSVSLRFFSVVLRIRGTEGVKDLHSFSAIS